MCKAQSGEKDGNSRLKVEDVIEIKKYLDKGVKQNKLAKQYGVS